MSALIVSVIIAEKPSMAKAIAQALLPVNRILDDFCWRDDFELSLDSNRRVPEHDWQRYYWEKDFTANQRIIPTHSDTKLGKGKRRQNSLAEKISSSRKKYRETVTYYILPVSGMNVDYLLICDTLGNPLNQNFPNQRDKFFPLKETLVCKQYSEYDSKFILSISDGGPWGRTAWFRYVIARQSFPCDGDNFKRSENFQLKNIFAATDFDIAGQYISYTVLMFCRSAYGKNFRPRSELLDDVLVRLDLNELSTKALSNSIRQPQAFNWSMAYAGETRAKLDFMIGQFSRTILNSAWSSLDENIYPALSHFKKIPFGRVQTGALMTLCLLHEQLESTPKRWLYFIFQGLPAWRNIKTKIKERDFCWIDMTEIRTEVSQANWLEKAKERNVGTHTTRYTQLRGLEFNGLANSNQRATEPTAFAKLYYSWLKNNLSNSPFDMSKINEELYDFFERIIAENSQIEAKKIQTEFISTFYRQYRIYLKEICSRQGYLHLSKQLSELATLLASHVPKEMPETVNSAAPVYDQEESVDKKSIELFGHDDVIDASSCEKLAKGISNASLLVRYLPKDRVDYLSLIQRLCCIEPGTEFSFHGWGNLDSVNSPATFSVFKAEFSDQMTSDYFNAICYSSQIQLRSILEVQSEIEETQRKENDEEAHQPLHLKGVKRSMIKGPSGLLLAQEYQAPWRYTLEMMKLEKAREELAKMFSIGGLLGRNNQIGHSDCLEFELSFTLVQKYQIGRVNNFESALCEMSRSYGLPFHFTADLMEKMYLSN